MAETVKLSLKRKMVPVELEGEDDIVSSYQLRDMDGSVFAEFVDGMRDRLVIEDGKVTGVSKFSGLQEALISRCMHDTNGVLVSEEVIKKWPSGVQKQLFELCMELIGLSVKEDDAKND